MKKVYCFPSYCVKIHLNIIILSTLMYFKLSLYFGLVHNFLCTFYLVFHEGHIPLKSQNTWFCHPNGIGWRVKSMNILKKFFSTCLYFLLRTYAAILLRAFCLRRIDRWIDNIYANCTKLKRQLLIFYTTTCFGLQRPSPGRWLT